MPRTSTLRYCTVLLALAVAAWLCYRPGLDGGFHFDDFVNLDLLGRDGPVSDWPSLLRYVTSGTADPTGRPVAMLSFLLDARDWPADPMPFLRTNLFLHIINGALLSWLLLLLGRSLAAETTSRAPGPASLLGAGLWLLHPLFVSTTLYAVQREAILPATFVLLGLIGYVFARNRLVSGGGRGTWFMLVAILGTTTLLAGLSKANGFLLPAFALVLESTIFREVGDARLRRPLRALLLAPCLVLAALVLAYAFRDGSYSTRGFTLEQRLLTEARVVTGYVGDLAAPRVLSDGLFNDDVPVSTSLLSPASTLPCVLFVVALPLLAFGLRRRAACWSAALGFFLVGHLLESTVLPLELRFEHRNYLPAMLLFWPLAWALYGGVRWPKLRHAAAIALLLIVSLLTWQRASLWGQPDRQTALWLAQHPHSPRTLAMSAMALRRDGKPALAIRLLEGARASAPADIQLALNLADALCDAGRFHRGELKMVAQALAGTRDDPLLAFRWLDDAIGQAAPCKLTPWAAQYLLDAAESNPRFRSTAGARQNLESLRGRLAIAQADRPGAAKHFRRSLLEGVRPEVAAAQTSMLLDAGYDAEAMQHLDLYLQQPPPPSRFGMPSLHAWIMRRQGYWDTLFQRMRITAAERMRSQ